MTAVVGRDAELAAIGDFLAKVQAGVFLLLLEGDSGMGKTTLWREAVAEAEERGLCVLQAMPAESESELSFAGLGDLLDPVLEEALEQLPSGQRSALSRALVLEDVEGPPPDAHAVGVSLLGALRALTASASILVAVDDVQWLDSASVAALTYAGRRLRKEPVEILLARRTGLASTVADELRRSLGERALTLDVGPLDAAALHRVVSDKLGATLPRPLLTEVQQASGGNPFYALEIVRMLKRSDVSIEAGQPIRVPDALHDLVHGRLLALPSESRDFLCAAAAHAHPTLSITEAASGVARTDGLMPALDAGIVHLDGERIRFTHPLIAAGAFELASPLRRREIHARLADLLDDPEARAWQLAACHNEPDEAVAGALESAAEHARARGAVRPAALLLDRACELTTPERRADALRRAVDAASLHYESGDSRRAESQLRDVIAGLEPGRDRANALVRLARVHAYDALPEALALFTQAVADAEDDPQILASAHLGVADCLWYLYERLEDATEHATLAAELALELDETLLAAEALASRFASELLLGLDTVLSTAKEAMALERFVEGGRLLMRPSFVYAADFLRFTGALEQARDDIEEMLRRAIERGDESSTPLALAYLGHIACELGALGPALEQLRAGQDAAEQSGQRTSHAFNLALESLVEARRGRVERAHEVAAHALELRPETGGRRAELIVAAALGQLELSRRSPAAAVARLEPAVAFARREAIVEPGVIPFVVDQVEALVELGRREEAIELLDWYEDNARRLQRASALANCARCRGLLAAQEGDVDAALAALEAGLTWHAEVELPLDRGRTLLALGAAQRRVRRRREARATLEEALAVFERIGAALWAERARAELKRISGRAATPGALTPAEERVALLVAEGKTNKEIAAALFLSDRTVEGHLSHVYAKLGIRHRAEVAAALAAHASVELES